MSPREGKRSWARAQWPWLCVGVVAALWIYGRASGGFAFGTRAGEALGKTSVEMLALLPPMFMLVGLFEVWLPRGLVERTVGEGAGPAAMLWMILLGVFQLGPIYLAFPVAASLLSKGCAPRNAFVYLGTFSAIKIPMLAFESAFLGWRFSLARVLITLPVVVVTGLVLEKLLPDVTCQSTVELVSTKGADQ